MKLLEKTLSLIGFEKRSNNGDNYWDNFKALRTGAVTPQAAETLSTVSACVSAISETIGSLPLHLYKRTPEGRERTTEHSLARVLHDAPNERQSALEFREMMTANMLLRGNAYARIIRGC
jgi:HK97 family phage portal protein